MSKHPGSSKWRGTPINPNPKKTDYTGMELSHPDDALCAEYIAAPRSQDLDRPLCFGVHVSGEPCRNVVRRGTRYCHLGRGD